MPVSTSRLAYPDCFDLLDRAMAGRGIRIKFKDYGACHHMRLRIHKARVIDREDNAKIYEEGHNLYGRSTYDVIRAEIEEKNGFFWLKLMKIDASSYEVEELEEEVEEPEIRRA